jgi:hypothetical protein
MQDSQEQLDQRLGPRDE